MEKEGIIRCSTSPWASPLHMVKKKDGSWRRCGDFQRLNLVTELDRYPLSNMLDRTLFSSHLWAKLCARLGVKHATTAAYHPQANGMVGSIILHPLARY
jgi:hypothetical protein